jgi:hypothetical protein
MISHFQTSTKNHKFLTIFFDVLFNVLVNWILDLLLLLGVVLPLLLNLSSLILLLILSHKIIRKPQSAKGLLIVRATLQILSAP